MKNKKWILINLLIICLLVCGSCVSAVTINTKTSPTKQLDIKESENNAELEPTGSIYGSVDEFRPGYQPRPPVRFALVDAGIKKVKTDFNGVFHLNNLPVGMYEITVSKKGYYPTTQTNIIVKEEKNRMLYFELYKNTTNVQNIIEDLSVNQDSQRSQQYLTRKTVEQSVNNQESLLWPEGEIIIHVKEIYGTIENPLYRPLANVTVKIYSKVWILPWTLEITSLTNESGEFDYSTVAGLYYLITISKDAFHAYKCSSSKKTTTGDKTVHVHFTMAEDSSPFVEQVSQISQHSSTSSSNQILQRLVNIR